ncbi:hypothetical protein GWI33_015693 [Rhynchophorus ferrugineus]|uniref:Uncharacterized protein n=1 Tax=Rhynchophorus ferrugineus TaxID=354439 RepID=A0A834M484_RHYFE|nr:hypothetical protein GWI33_015693 [Rhynchophorus ferrugineus]
MHDLDFETSQSQYFRGQIIDNAGPIIPAEPRDRMFNFIFLLITREGNDLVVAPSGPRLDKEIAANIVKEMHGFHFEFNKIANRQPEIESTRRRDGGRILLLAVEFPEMKFL